MQRNRKLFVIIPALVMSLMILLTACSGGGSGSSESMQQNVTVGKRVFVHEASGVVYYGYKNLICSALMKDGAITEFIPEGGTTGNIFAMAVYGDELYISASDGFFKYPLSMFTDGSSNASATTLIESDYALSEFNTFEIFEDKIFFIYGSTLCYMPTDGGSKTPLADEVTDFEVTDKGIYYTKKGGELMLMSSDLKEKESLGSISTIKGINPGGMNFYYSDGTKIYAFSVKKEASEELGNNSQPSEYEIPWSNGESVLFCNSSYNAALLSGGKETELGSVDDFPLKSFGTMSGDYLIYTSGDYKTMGVYDLRSSAFTTYDLEAEMKSYLDKLGGDSNAEPQTGTAAGAEAYDIMKGFMRNASADTTQQYMYFNDFLLVMPNDGEIGFDGSGDQVDFVYLPARDAGFGGRLMSIKAYDLNDDSYRNIPSYHIAGVGPNVNKRFVVIYPTDLQCDSNDAAQMEKYKQLHEYVLKINEGSGDSPLQTADSD